MVRNVRGLLVGALVAFLSVSFHQASAVETSLLQAGPMVGHVTSTGATVWLRSKFGTEPHGEAIQGSRTYAPTKKEHLGSNIWHLKFGGLQPAQLTEVKLWVVGRNGTEEAPSAQFRTAPLAANSGRVRIAFGSCLKVSEFGDAPVMRALAEEKPDMMIYVGDNSYFIVGDGSDRHFSTTGPWGDWSTFEGMMARHLVGRMHPDVAAALRVIPSYAIWDDHDYGPNNADRTFALKDEALFAFRMMWANPGWGHGVPGGFSSFRHGPVEVFLMDDRFHKISPLEHPERTAITGEIWGEEQTNWLIGGLKASQAPVKVIANGTQVLSAMGSGEGHHQEALGERARLLNEISAKGIGGVVFISGDRHFSEAMQMPLNNGALVVEGTSSPLQQGQEVGPVDRPHDHQLWSMRGNSFGLLTIEVDEDGSGYVQYETRGASNENPSVDGVPMRSRWDLADLRPKASSASVETAMTEDPYLWLEEVEGERALDWARDRNRDSEGELTEGPEFDALKTRLLSILDSKDRIPGVSKHGAHLYNFWRDESHPRGVYRRTTLASYKTSEPEWETVLDLDALAAAEDENWVWKGIRYLSPEDRLGLVSLSRGGADATVVREFDVLTKSFVEGGFTMPEAKSRASWKDKDTLYIGTDFGPGSLTDSGYPRVVKEWRRGTPIESATTVFEGEKEDVSVGAWVSRMPGRQFEMIERSPTFFTNKAFLNWEGAWTPVDKPDGAEVSIFRDQLLFELRADWDVGGTVYDAGSVLAIGVDAFMSGDRSFGVLFQPTPRTGLARGALSQTENWLLINTLDNVRSRLFAWRLTEEGWENQEIESPVFGSASIYGLDSDDGDLFWLSANDFLTPTTLYLGGLGDQAQKLEAVKASPGYFETEGLRIEQHEATSADGTKIPYFLVSKEGLKRDNSNPTLLYGYGGFEIPLSSSYSATLGATWLEAGGVYALANIRGGGEFGPAWHQAALKANRQRAYDDFIAVGEDLVARGVTAPRHLGIRGGSNGGLLMGNMLVQRPDLFRAVVCQVPLLDMKRYNKLLAGASWMGEYGNPDVPEEWAFLKNYSPYQLVDSDVEYPRMLVTTSTRDDRVHPGHARKMVAKMLDQGHDVLYYENMEGGHGGAANNAQTAHLIALYTRFLWRELK